MTLGPLSDIAVRSSNQYAIIKINFNWEELGEILENY